MRIKLLTLGLVAVVAGCSEGTSDIDLDLALLDNDVALVAADGVLSDLASDLAMVSALGSDRAGRGERNVTKTYLDAAGNVQEAYDELTTATIIRSVTMSREGSREGWTASVDATREQTITGLLGEEWGHSLLPRC